MARIKTGSIVADIAGKVGDNIYSRNASGPYVKTFAAPTITPSSYTAAAHQALADANTAWGSISQAEYNLWVSFSKKFPRSTFHNGYAPIDPKALFVSCFINQFYSGLSPAPLPVTPPSNGFLSIDLDLYDPVSPSLLPVGGSSSTDFSILYYSSAPVNPTVRSVNTLPLYFIGAVDYSISSKFYFQTAFFNRFGVLPTVKDMRTFVKARVIHKSSGLQVGESWTSDIFLGTVTPAILGNTTIESIERSDSRPYAFRVQSLYNGTLNSISLYCRGTSDTVTFALYSDSGSLPSALLGQSLPIPTTASSGWLQGNLITPVGITAGSYYWLAFYQSSVITFNTIFYSGNTASSSYFGAIPQNPWQLQSTNAWKPSIFANVDYFI